MSSITIKRDDKTNIVVQVVTPEESNKIISAEDAEMDIRNSNLPVRTYHVPDGLGTVWTVFRYDPVTQTFTDINMISA